MKISIYYNDMRVWLQKNMHALSYSQHSPHILTLSCCIGTYIAFSPFVGLHTLMALACIWLFDLNAAMTFAFSCGINNPWTTLFVYGLDYVFGYWILHDLAKYDAENPACIAWAEKLLVEKIGLSMPCVWSFLIGGNILGILAAVMLYVPLKKIFTFFVRKPQTLDKSDSHL